MALTDYGSLEEVLRAVTDLPYEGGSRRIGDALQFLVDHMFSPVVSRDHVPKVRYFTRENSFRGLSVRKSGGLEYWKIDEVWKSSSMDTF